MLARALFHIAPQQVECREVELAPLLEHQVLIKSRYSAISPGTESLIFRNRMPKDTVQDDTIKSLSGSFNYPFSYGYSLVGTVIDAGGRPGSDFVGQQVFAFHPHHDYAVVSIDDCLVIPDGISALNALFLANTESALNFVMDGNPTIGESVLVIGQGIVGLLTTTILATFPLGELISADPRHYRRQRSLESGATLSINPNDQERWHELKNTLFDTTRSAQGADLAFELSGNMKALSQAMEIMGFSAKIVVGSWYGTGETSLNLSSDFHRRRIQLISSQVSTINPLLSGRWDKLRRIELTWQWIRKLQPERFITHQFPLQQCQEAFELIQRGTDDLLQVVFNY